MSRQLIRRISLLFLAYIFSVCSFGAVAYESETELGYANDRVIVQLRTNSGQISTFSELQGGSSNFLGVDTAEVKTIMQHTPQIGQNEMLRGAPNGAEEEIILLTLKKAGAEYVWEAIEILKQNPCVIRAHPDYIYRLNETPNDPKFDEGFLYGLEKISAPQAWDITTGSREVVAAVIDTGIDYTHPDIRDNMWSNPNEIPDNGIDDDGNGLVDDIYGWNFISWNNDIMDYDSHGTHVAGTIGAVRTDITHDFPCL